MLPNFSQNLRHEPFPHALKLNALSEENNAALLNWLENDAPWTLKIAEFYQQYEFSFHDLALPPPLDVLFAPDSVAMLKQSVEQIFGVSLSQKVDIAAHKLVGAQVIRIHNDYIPGQETHRVLIQLNRGWEETNGGILMIFSDRNPESLASAFLPLNNSAFAFAISPKSFHAVSTIKSGERYTVVFSFFKDDN
jgi:Rps23 Pro-64 3,4-dihydroxylase Tpa1-like proline 4-hydroxylase